jgi:hypothetical protein
MAARGIWQIEHFMILRLMFSIRQVLLITILMIRLKTTLLQRDLKNPVTARVALQHIGIAGMAAVYQDRNGVMQIKPFASIDSGGNYSTYPGTGIYSGFDPIIPLFIHKSMMVTGCGDWTLIICGRFLKYL